MRFTDFNLAPPLQSGIDTAGYQTPTPIQQQAIPAILKGGDVMGLAQTGTGKTAAFALPILHRLLDGPRGRVRALIIAPTRELAEQIHQSITTLANGTSLRSMTLFGGVGINPQIQKLKQGVEIVVACPGRLLDHIGQKHINLRHLEVLVLDEADQMFDMGFFPSLRRILSFLPAKRQNLLFSATMPTEIRKLAQEILCQPQEIKVASNAAAVTVRHALFPVPAHLKNAILFELLKQTDTESVLIFTRTKHRAKRLGQQLERRGYRAASLQGNLSQNRRQAALGGFRDGTYQILVATDIAARGIDVSQVSHVINFDIPDTPEAYIHRIGRTGRAARHGDAFTLVSDEDKSMIRAIERILKEPLPRRTLETFDYHQPAPEPPPRAPRPSRQKTSPAAKRGRHARSNGEAAAPTSPPSRRPKPKKNSHPRRGQGQNSQPQSTSG